MDPTAFLEAPLRALSKQQVAAMSEDQLREFVTQLRANRAAQTFRATLARQAERESGQKVERGVEKVNKALEEFF
jgi:hypothetical protein